MKLFAKAGLAALALASAFAATVPANAAVVERSTTVVIHRGCANCVNRAVNRAIARHFVRRAIRHEIMREAFRHERHEAMRQAFLQRRFEDNR